MDQAVSISTSDGDAEARCRLALHEILMEQRVLLILDSFECSQSQSVWVEFLESLQQSKRCRSFCILAHCSMLETIRGGVAGESAGQSSKFFLACRPSKYLL
jgi:hypothetical protein